MNARIFLAGLGLAAIAAISGCASAPSNMVAFTTQLRGANEVPANASTGSGSVDAALNKDKIGRASCRERVLMPV